MFSWLAAKRVTAKEWEQRHGHGGPCCQTGTGFRAGDGNGHHLYNRSSKIATYLVVSNRHRDDRVNYADEDLAVQKGPDGKYVFTRKDGAPIAG